MTDFLNRCNSTIYKELKVKHLKVIYKSLFGDDPEPQIVFLNFYEILKDITFLPECEIEKLNFVDLFLLLIDIRIMSIGNTIFTTLQDTNTKIEFNISKIKEQIIEYSKTFSKQVLKFDNNITITFNLPSINDIIFINENQDINKFYGCFIEQIEMNGTIINISNLNLNDKNIIFEQLPAKITSAFIKQVINCINYFNNTNLISYLPQIQNISVVFNFNIKNLIGIMKFLFGENLTTLYENIFALCKVGNFTPEYIENCTPGEYLLYVKKLEQLNTQSTPQQSTAYENVNDSLDDDLKDINPYNSPDLPPITSQTDLSNFSP